MCIMGHHHQPVPSPSPRDKPVHIHATPMNHQGVQMEPQESTSSDQIDNKIKEHLEARAIEWCVKNIDVYSLN